MLQKLLSQIIKKPFGNYQDESSLKLILKRRFTKKEFKLFILKAKSVEEQRIREILKLSEEEFFTIWSKITKKVNKNLLKEEIFIKDTPKKA